MIRPLQLTDIAPLMLFLGKSPVNEARTRDRFNYEEKRSLSFLHLLKECVFPGGKEHSLVCVEGGHIRGLACLRRRGGPGVWEIERLLLAQGQESFCLELLEGLGSAGDEIRVERLFLRLECGSPLVDTARQAGFSHYLTELLYRLEEGCQSQAPGPLLTLRPKSNADEYGLFRLYSAAVPVKVRSVEGMTFREWRDSGDRTAAREFVLESEGEVSASLRIRFDGTAGQFDAVTTLEATELSGLVNSSLSVLEGRKPVYCLVPEFQAGLPRMLEEQGFRHVADYSCLSRQLEVRVREPKLVPIRA